MVKLKMKCSDLGYDCDFEATSNFVDDIIYKIGEHLNVKHHVQNLDDEIKDKIKWYLKAKLF